MKMDGLKNIEVPAEHHLSRMQRGIPVERKPAQCPVCGSKSVKPILYGMPSPDCDFSKYIIGGCCIQDDSPDWGCESCGADFIRKGAGKTK